MIKTCFINLFKRFKYFFICFGLILVGFLGAALILYGGLALTFHLQGNELLNEVSEYLRSGLKNIRPTDVISLSIVTKIYHDFINIAGENAYSVKVGITISAVLAVFALYGSYKGGVGLVNYLTKRELRDIKTKHGFVPFLIKLAIGLAFSFALLVLLHLWKWSFIFVLFFYILIDSFEEVITTRYVYFSDVKLKNFIVSKDFIRVMFLYLLFQYVIILIASLLWLVTPWLSILIMIPVLAYSETNIEYTIITTYKHS